MPPGRAARLYDALIATHPDVQRKGKSIPYTAVNGNMFTILSANGTLGMCLADAPTGRHSSPPTGRACTRRTAQS
jgi:hypothetical protein